MDVIEKAIKNGWHLSENKKINSQTWGDFENVLYGKDIFLFGVGAGADYYFHRYKGKLKIAGIIDNNRDIQNVEAKEIISEIEGDDAENLKISDVSVLNKYDINRIVIIITSLKHYIEIADQLEELNITNCFSLLVMEAIKRSSEREQYEEYGIDYYIEAGCKQKVDNKKIVLITMSDYAGHGKEIVRQLLKIRNDLDIVWLVNNLNMEVLTGIRLVYRKNYKKCAYEMETAKVWICDTFISRRFIKRPEQIYVQIKHWASVTLKSFGFDLAQFRKDKAQIEICEYNRKIMDYIITGSEFDERTCRSGFAFDGDFFRAGSPRSDILFLADKCHKKICALYGIDRKVYILLYAPTFRSKQGQQYIPEASHIDLNYALVKEALEHKFGGEWLILLRLHPVVASASKNILMPNYVKDVSSYADSEELVAASDIMITDYSSIMFEPAFVKKPVFLFAPDRKEYINGERSLLIDYDKLPFPISESNEELVENIMKFEIDQYKEHVEKFLAKYGINEDGHAGERAAKFVLQVMNLI